MTPGWGRRVTIGAALALFGGSMVWAATSRSAPAPGACGPKSIEVAPAGSDWLTSEGYSVQGRIFRIRHPRSWQANLLPDNGLEFIDTARGSARMVVMVTNEVAPSPKAVRSLSSEAFNAAAKVVRPGPPRTATLGERQGCFLRGRDQAAGEDVEGLFAPVDDHVLAAITWFADHSPAVSHQQARSIASSIEVTDEYG